MNSSEVGREIGPSDHLVDEDEYGGVQLPWMSSTRDYRPASRCAQGILLIIRIAFQKDAN